MRDLSGVGAMPVCGQTTGYGGSSPVWVDIGADQQEARFYSAPSNS
jgi:hypothetical protein